MTELYIDGQLCDMPGDLDITLVTENLYFSSASTYSYETKLPITPLSNNAKIFSNINRLDKKIKNVSYKAKLVVDNKVILNGTATVIEITDKSVSIQLLQGRSEMNWKNKLNETYVDELDLGTVDEWGIEKTDDGKLTIISELEVSRSWNYTYYYFEQKDFKEHNNGEVVLCPIWNENTATMANPLCLTTSLNNLALHDDIRLPSGLEPNHHWRPNNIAVQPKLHIIISKLFNALNISIVENQLEENDFYKDIFVANSTVVWKIADMLPHLTVVDFIEQFEVFFNCVVDIFTENKARIILRKNFYNKTGALNASVINDIIDEYSISVEEEEVSDSDQHRIYGIEYPDYKTKFLGHTFDTVKIIDESELTATANPNVFARRPNGHKISSPYKDRIVKGNDIDRFEPSPAETDGEFVMKFLPVNDYDLYYASYHDWPRMDVSGQLANNLYLCTTSSVGKYDEIEDETIQKLLDDLDQPEEKEYIETLYLGFLTKAQQITGATRDTDGSVITFDYDILTSVYDKEYIEAPESTSDIHPEYYGIEGWNFEEIDYDMSLIPLLIHTNPREELNNLYHNFYVEKAEIKTNIIYKINFITREILNPLYQFIIKNQNYVARQITYHITAKGFSKISEGEFYKL